MNDPITPAQAVAEIVRANMKLPENYERPTSGVVRFCISLAHLNILLQDIEQRAAPTAPQPPAREERLEKSPFIGGDGPPVASCLLCGHHRQLAVWYAGTRAGVCAECRARAASVSGEAEPPQATSLAGCLAHQRTLRADIKRLKEELRYTTAAGVIECAIRNPAVSEYMNHWEGRTIKAEAAVAALADENAKLKAGAKEIHESYLRIRKITDAYNTAWGGADRFEVTERAVQALKDRVKELEA